MAPRLLAASGLRKNEAHPFLNEPLRHRLLRPPPSGYSAKPRAEHTPGTTGVSNSPPKAALFPRGVRDPIHNGAGHIPKIGRGVKLAQPCQT